METKDKINLKSLGKKTSYPKSYSPQVLEAIPNFHKERDFWVTLSCPEFTSLCPITFQPDFAVVIIRYVPKNIKLNIFW